MHYGISTTLSRIERLTISVSGISCAIISEDAGFLDLLRTRYRWFESSSAADYEITVELRPLEEFVERTIQSPRTEIRRANSRDKYIIRRTDNPFVAVVNTSSKKVVARMWNNVYCFDSLLRMLFALIVTGEKGLLLHSSAVSDGKQGSVFFGPSESGKTTVARLSNGRTILTDELAIIKPCNGGYRVHGTPFWGEFTPGRSNALAQLSGLYALKKAKVNHLVPMDRAQAIAELYRCVLFFGNDVILLRQILDTCCDLVNAVPVYELHFLPDSSFWQIVDERRQHQRGEVCSASTP